MDIVVLLIHVTFYHFVQQLVACFVVAYDTSILCFCQNRLCMVQNIGINVATDLIHIWERGNQFDKFHSYDIKQ